MPVVSATGGSLAPSVAVSANEQRKPPQTDFGSSWSVPQPHCDRYSSSGQARFCSASMSRLVWYDLARAGAPASSREQGGGRRASPSSSRDGRITESRNDVFIINHSRRRPAQAEPGVPRHQERGGAAPSEHTLASLSLDCGRGSQRRTRAARQLAASEGRTPY